MMNIYELCYLNRALDGKDLFSVPSFSNLQHDERTETAVRNAMTARGYLSAHNTFSPEAVEQLKLIQAYKTAEKYVVVNDTAFGVIGEIGIMLKQSDKEYTFYRISMKDSDRKLMKVYESFFNTRTLALNRITGRFIDHDMFARQFNPSDGEFLKITTVAQRRDHTVKTDELFFICENRLYLYDFNSQLLLTPDLSRVNSILKARLSV